MMELCLFYDLCVPTLVVDGDGAFGRIAFEASGDPDVRALADPFKRARPDMLPQLDALLRQILHMRRFATETRVLRLATEIAPHMQQIVTGMRTADPLQLQQVIAQWAEADPDAHAAQVYALYTTLVGIRTISGPQGISHGMPPSLRTTRFSEFSEYNERLYPGTPAGDGARLYDWCADIIRIDGPVFWARLDRYIAYIEHEWLGRIVFGSPSLHPAMLRRLEAVPTEDEEEWQGVAFVRLAKMMGMRRLGRR
jgi:hypothetical protein